MFCCPGIGFAIGFGAAELQSKLGEPLLMRVGLILDAGEKVDESCLSLTVADPSTGNLHEYFSRTQMTIKTEGGRQYVSISSPRPFNALFANVQLQIKCRGIGNLSKTLTILPDLDLSPAPAPVHVAVAVAASAPLAAPVAPTPVASEVVRNTAEMPPAIAVTPGVRRKTQGKARPSGERHIVVNPVAHANYDHPSAASAPSGGSVRPQSPAVSAKKPGTPIKLPAGAQQENQNTQLGLLVGAGLLFAVLALWQGLKYYSHRKSRQSEQPDLEKSGGQDAASGINPLPVAVFPGESPGRHAEQFPGAPVPVTETSQPSSSIKSKEELAKDDSMLEEAELYATHGHPDKAVEILREIIAQNPTYTEAWVLLMSILSSLGKAKDFERSARDFFKLNPQSDSWKMIQALGRTLDQGNPLYAGDKNLDVTASVLKQLTLNKKRLVGSILVEMGALSEQDLLNCMAGFDPKRHGRFGEYLISQKMITDAQLNKALLHQQEVGVDSLSGTRVTLQDMEDFLAGFDPGRDGSIGEYLVSQGVITPDQFKGLQQNSEAEPASPVFDLDKPAVASRADDAEDSRDYLPVPDKLTRPPAIEAGSDTGKIKEQDQPLIAEIPSYAAIDFDIGSVMPDKPDA